jgi:signal transduction histidine kinase
MMSSSNSAKIAIVFVLFISIAFSSYLLYGYNKLAKELFMQQHGVRLTGALQTMIEESYSLAIEAKLSGKKELLDESISTLEASVGIIGGNDFAILGDMNKVIEKIEHLALSIESLEKSDSSAPMPANIASMKKDILSVLEEYENVRWEQVTYKHGQLIEKLENINYLLFGSNIIFVILSVVVWRLEAQKERAKNELLEVNKNLEATIEEKTAKLRLASESKSIFLSNMSHDIKTPLNSIIGHASMALQEAEEPKIKKQLETILHSAEYLAALATDIMDISCAESGRVRLSKEKFNPIELQTNIYGIFGSAALQKKITFDVLTNVDDRVVIVGDKQKILRVLSNLVSNAINFTPTGGVVTVRIEKRPQNIYYFEVSDTGQGIARGAFEKIFEPFFQINSSSKTGNGLGLFIVKSYLDAMGSSINVESVKDKGTSFSFELLLEPIPVMVDEKASIYKDEPLLDEEQKSSILASAKLGHVSALKKSIAEVQSVLLRKKLLNLAELFDMKGIADEIDRFEQEGHVV